MRLLLLLALTLALALFAPLARADVTNANFTCESSTPLTQNVVGGIKFQANGGVQCLPVGQFGPWRNAGNWFNGNTYPGPYWVQFSDCTGSVQGYPNTGDIGTDVLSVAGCKYTIVDGVMTNVLSNLYDLNNGNDYTSGITFNGDDDASGVITYQIYTEIAGNLRLIGTGEITIIVHGDSPWAPTGGYPMMPKVFATSTNGCALQWQSSGIVYGSCAHLSDQPAVFQWYQPWNYSSPPGTNTNYRYRRMTYLSGSMIAQVHFAEGGSCEDQSWHLYVNDYCTALWRNYASTPAGDYTLHLKLEVGEKAPNTQGDPTVVWTGYVDMTLHHP